MGSRRDDSEAWRTGAREGSSSGASRGHERLGVRAPLSDSAYSFDAQSRAAGHLTFTCRSPPADGMRKVLVQAWTIGSLASAHAWSSRDANSAVCAAWEGPTAWRDSPAAAEELKAIPEDNVAFAEGRGRGVVQMLSGAVLLFLIGGTPFVGAVMVRVRISLARDILVPDEEEDEQPLTERVARLNAIFEQEVALPDRLPDPEPSCSDADFVDQFRAQNRRDLARNKIRVEWFLEECAVLGIEEYDPDPIPYCQRSPYYEGPGFEVPLSDLDSDSDSESDADY